MSKCLQTRAEPSLISSPRLWPALTVAVRMYR